MKTFLTILVVSGILLLEYLIGGTRLLFALPGLELMAIAGVLVFFIKDRNDRLAGALCIGSALAFVGYVLIRNRLSPVDYIGRLQFFNAVGCLIIYLLWTQVVDTPRKRKWFFTALIILALGQVLIGLVQFREGNQWMIQAFTSRKDDWWRASGLYISPNHFAGYLEVVGLMGLSLAVWGRMRLYARVLLIYAVMCCLVGIAISGSRGGYLSTAGGLVAFVMLSLGVCHRLQRDRFWLLLISSVVGLVVVIGTALTAMSVSESIKGRLANINEMENIRVPLWQAALEQFHQAPVFGTGGFTYLYYGRLFRDPGVQLDPIHVHGDYLQLLAEYGVVGAILFVLFLGVHLYWGGKGIRELMDRGEEEFRARSDRLALVIGAFSGVVAYMIHSVVDFNMQIPANAIIMATMFGILASPLAPVAMPVEDWSNGLRKRVYGWLLPAVSLLVLIYGLPMLPGEWYAEKARQALREKDPVGALMLAQSGIKYEKNNPDLYYYAGEAARVLLNEEATKGMLEPGLAVGYFQQGLRVFPMDSRLQFKLANALSDEGHYLEARKVMQLAEQWDPNSAYYYAYLGLIEQRGGFLDEAQAAYSDALDLDFNNLIAVDGLKVVEGVVEKVKQKFPDTVIVIEDAPASGEPEAESEPEANGVTDLRNLHK